MPGALRRALANRTTAATLAMAPASTPFPTAATPPRIGWRDRLLAAWWRRRWRGFIRLRRMLHPAGVPAPITFATPYGSTFQLDPHSYIDAIVLREGFYESEVVEALLPELGAGRVLWDIGANFGLHATTLARLSPGTVTVAFEPHPGEHARLLQHRRWNAPRLITAPLALSDVQALLPLQPGPTGNPGMTAVGNFSAGTPEGALLVAAVAGDALIASGLLPSPTAVKLDVEGHEAAVLRGMARALASPALSIVVFEDSQEPDTAPKQLLRAAGLQITLLERREETFHPLQNFAARRASAR